MFKQLADFAWAEGLINQPHYCMEPIDYIFKIGSDGRVLDIEERKDQKKRASKVSIPIPPTGRTSNNLPAFVNDKAEFALAVNKGLEEESEKRQARVPVRHKNFTELVKKAADETKDAGLIALNKFFTDILQGDPNSMDLPAELNSGSRVAFQFEDSLITDRSAVVKWWQNLRDPKNTHDAMCIVCGKSCDPVRLHNPVSVLGGKSHLVAYNIPSAEYHGLEQGDNAPTCINCVDAYTAGFSRLMTKNFPSPDGSGSLQNHYISLTSSPKDPPLVAVFWPETKVEAFDLLWSVLSGGDADSVRALYRSVWNGKPVKLDDKSHFYGMLLSWNKGNVIIKSYLQTTIAEAAKNITQHFTDLGISPDSMDKPLNLYRLAACIGKNIKDVHPNLLNELLQSIVLGYPYPTSLLIALVNVIGKSRIGPVRAALLRAVLRRRTKEDLANVVDVEYQNVGYRLGRLFALLAHLQKRVIWNIQKTIVDTHFRSAMMTPALAFPKLMALSQHHLKKSRVYKYKIFVHNTIAEILDPLGKNAFPIRLSLEDQGKFALGYYQQRAELYRKKTKTEEDVIPPEPGQTENVEETENE